jgi:hypothetical protein
VEEFTAPANNNDSIEIDAEEAEIAAAIAEASEKGTDQGEELEGFSTGEQIFAGENVEAQD